MAPNWRTRGVAIENCVSGMRIARDLYTKNNNLIIPAGAILDEYAISRLDSLLVPYVEIYDISENEVAHDITIFEQEYVKHVSSIKNIFSRLETGNLLRMEDVRPIVGSIINCSLSNRDVLHSLNTLRDIDEYTYTHSLNVGIFSMMLARWLGKQEESIKQVCFAGVLHDIGKAVVPDSILNKPEKLTNDEFNIIKRHSSDGYDILKNNQEISDEIRQGVLMHHERIDGSGYPNGTLGPMIHANGKIIAIADVFDAMVSDRCYHQKENPFVVLDHFETECLGHLDSVYLAVFVKRMSAYFLGEKVYLSDGRSAEVIFINPQCLSRPIIQIIDQVIDLSKDLSISITGLAEKNG